VYGAATFDYTLRDGLDTFWEAARWLVGHTERDECFIRQLRRRQRHAGRLHLLKRNGAYYRKVNREKQSV
jgi:hypothetical protein